MPNLRTKSKVILLAPLAFFLFWGINAKAASYNFFVDANSTQEIQDGTQDHPWKTITQALDYINEHKLKKKKIYVAGGTYVETLTVRYGTKLYGKDKNSAILDADGHQNAINFESSSSTLKDFTIKNSEATAVIVDKKSKVTINNCSIEKAGKYGIEVKESTAADKYMFTFKNSSVSDSGSQGLYISRRKISLTDNEIFSNDEEGIDLHQGVKGKVSGNHIHGNSESGFESILSGANLTFRGNHIENNHTQGLTVQVYSTKNKGKIKITRNTIRDNHEHGIRYANYTHSIGPKKFKVFTDKYVKKSKNTIKNNGEEEIYYQ